MNTKFDTIVIGAGIAGLLTALRLSQQGQKVLVIEKDKIGDGSTLANHGMVHSGALYVRRHSHIVNQCKEAQVAFTALFRDARVTNENSLYICPQTDIKNFTKFLNLYDFEHQVLPINKIPEVKTELARKYIAVVLNEGIFSSGEILKLLTAYCLANKVSFLLGTQVFQITKKLNRVNGVLVAANQMLKSNNVVIATGLGTTQLLQRFNSHYCKFLKSRLDIMVHLPQSILKRGVIFAELDKPVLIPARGPSVLGSYFGGIQPPINGDRKFPVDFDKAKLLIKMIDSYFSDKFINTKNSQFYMSGKTDYTETEHTEKGFINPGFYIIDHTNLDKISGLYTIVTGKMTLAFHASKAVADLILEKNTDFLISQSTKVDAPDNMFTVEPWANLQTT